MVFIIIPVTCLSGTSCQKSIRVSYLYRATEAWRKRGHRRRLQVRLYICILIILFSGYSAHILLWAITFSRSFFLVAQLCGAYSIPMNRYFHLCRTAGLLLQGYLQPLISFSDCSPWSVNFGGQLSLSRFSVEALLFHF